MEWEHLPTEEQLTFDESPEEGEASVAEHVLYDTALRELNIEDDFFSAWFGDDEAEELGAALANNTTLCDLRFQDCSFGERGLEGIAEALETNTTLRIIQFDSMRETGDAGAGIMADALASTTSLETLHMSDCDIGALGCRAIADALKINTSLKTLSFHLNKLRYAGATALADALASTTTLTELSMECCSVCERGSRAIADALRINTSLKKLNITTNEEIRDGGATAIADALASNSSLTELSIAECDVGALGCRAIADALKINSSLEILDISGNVEMEDAGATTLADALASTTSLTQLHCCDCGIGALGCRALADALKINTSLVFLDIGWNNEIEDAGATALAEALASTSTLAELVLRGCDVGELGCRAIADALGINTSLEVLDISSNREVGDAGATALADALASTSSLTKLDVYGCDIGRRGTLALGRAWGNNLALSLDFDISASFDDPGIREEAVRVRDAIIHRQHCLLAFAMGMHDRLGGGPRALARITRSTTRMCPYHFMCDEVFKLVGDAYE